MATKNNRGFNIIRFTKNAMIILAAFCFMLVLATACTGSNEIVTPDGLVLVPVNNEYYVYGYKGNSDEVAIPLTYDGKAIAGLGNGYRVFKCPEGLKKISLSGNIKYVLMAQYGVTLSEIEVDEANERYTSINGILYTKDLTELICYPYAHTAESWELPATLTKISDALGPNIAEVVAPEDNTVYKTIDGVLYNKTVTNLVFYPYEKSDAHFILPDTVTETVYKLNENKFLESVAVGDDSTTFAAADGVLYNKALSEMVCYPYMRGDADFELSAEITKIYPITAPALKTLTVLAAFPPRITYDAAEFLPAVESIMVSADKLGTYKNNYYWKIYKDKINTIG